MNGTKQEIRSCLEFVRIYKWVRRFADSLYLNRKVFSFLVSDNKVDSTIIIFRDRKSTRLNSSHLVISYAVFCLKKKKKNNHIHIFLIIITRIDHTCS